MYTTKAIAKKVQNGNFEVIEIERLQDISTPNFSTPAFHPKLFIREFLNCDLFSHCPVIQDGDYTAVILI